MYTGCNMIPIYNYENETKNIFCSVHNQEGMVNTIVETCTHSGCKTCPKTFWWHLSPPTHSTVWTILSDLRILNYEVLCVKEDVRPDIEIDKVSVKRWSRLAHRVKEKLFVSLSIEFDCCTWKDVNVGGVEEDRSPKFAPLGWMICTTVDPVDDTVSWSTHISTCVSKESEGESVRGR